MKIFTMGRLARVEEEGHSTREAESVTAPKATPPLSDTPMEPNTPCRVREMGAGQNILCGANPSNKSDNNNTSLEDEKRKAGNSDESGFFDDDDDDDIEILYDKNAEENNNKKQIVISNSEQLCRDIKSLLGSTPGTPTGASVNSSSQGKFVIGFHVTS